MDTSEPSYPSLWKKVAETKTTNKQTGPLTPKLLMTPARNLWDLAIKIYVSKKYIKVYENTLMYA